MAGRWQEGNRLLESLVCDERLQLPPLTRYRANSLLAWTRMGSGESSALILEAVNQAEQLGIHDPMMANYCPFAAGQATARQRGLDAMASELAPLPPSPAQFPPDQSYLLAWREAVRTYHGLFPHAVADLREAEQRICNGLTDIAHGGFHGIFGVAQWMHGRSGLAKVSFGLAVEVSTDFTLPLVLTYTPLHLSGTGHAGQERTRNVRNSSQTTSVLTDNAGESRQRSPAGPPRDVRAR